MIRKILRHIMLLLLLVVAIAYWGWMQLGKIIEAGSTSLPAGVSLSYDYHFVDVNGNLILINPGFSWAHRGEFLQFDKLIFKPSHWNEYFSLEHNLKLDQFPETAEFIGEKFTLKLNQLVDIHDKPSELRLVQLLLKGCEPTTDLTIRNLIEMGITELKGDIKSNYSYTELSTKLKLSSEINIPDFIGIEWNLELNDVLANSTRIPYLVSSQWVFYNIPFLSKTHDHCAKSLEQPIETFLQDHANKVFSFLLTNKWIISSDLKRQYLDFIANPENFSITLTPSTGIQVPKLAAMSYAEFLTSTGLAMTINSKSVQPIMIVKEPIETTEEQIVSSNVQPKVNPNILIEPTEAQITEILNRSSKITLKNQKNYLGKPLLIEWGKLKFEVKNFEGTLVLSFDLNDIEKIELLK